jgi:hypothetical protein
LPPIASVGDVIRMHRIKRVGDTGKAEEKNHRIIIQFNSKLYFYYKVLSLEIMPKVDSPPW